MTRPQHHLALDLGSSGGKIVLGEYNGRQLRIEEVHRFANQPVEVLGTIHWDMLRIMHEIQTGISLADKLTNGTLRSIGTDSWGVDFGILNKDGMLLGNPVHYRDRRTDGVSEDVFRRVADRELFERTGVSSMEINSLFQLHALRKRHPHTFEQIDRVLPIPDLVNYFLTGQMATEFSIASTTQLIHAQTRNWDDELLDALQFSKSLFPDVVPTGHRLGQVLGNLLSSACEVINVAQHDTASAFAAMPFADATDASQANTLSISLGSWGIIGSVMERPLINDQIYRMKLTNEGGYAHNYMLIKNLSGLFLLQECYRDWNGAGQSVTYSQMTEWAEQAKPFQYWVDPDHERLFQFGKIDEKLKSLAWRSRLVHPASELDLSKGQIVRCLLESLAFKYRHAIEELASVTGRRIETITLVGGAVRNKLLCQFLANATHVSVQAGPGEATAIGNLLIQMIAHRELADIREAKELVRRSFRPDIYEPQETSAWNEHYESFIANMENGEE